MGLERILVPCETSGPGQVGNERRLAVVLRPPNRATLLPFSIFDSRLLNRGNQRATSDPIFSPNTTRPRFPGTFRLKTIIGKLLSMHMEIAVVSMTASPRDSTSKYLI